MMPLPPLSLKTPSRPEEALQALAAEGAAPLAGGSDLIPGLAWEIPTCDTLVSLAGLEALRRIEAEADGRLRIGAMATLAEIVRHPLIRVGYPALADAAQAVASPELRAQGTIGGNVCLGTRCRFRNQPPLWREALAPCWQSGGAVCHAAPAKETCVAILSGDTVPALVALRAEAEIWGPAPRRLPLEELYSGDGSHHLRIALGEILAALRLPAAPPQAAFRKWRTRASIDFPEANAAVSAVWRDGAWREPVVVVSAVGPAPIRVQAAEALLDASAWSEERILAAGELARRAVHPYDNGQLNVAGRQIAVRGLVARALGDMETERRERVL